ncbi:hypothetical protein BH11MYX2_BH11MYX2_22510 [soil metagenome]
MHEAVFDVEDIDAARAALDAGGAQPGDIKRFDGIDSMVTAANDRNDSAFTNMYSSSLNTPQALLSGDRLWERLLKETHVTQKKLPAPPAD